MSLKKFFQFFKFFIGWPISLLAVLFIGRIVIQNKSIISRFEHINPALLFFSIVSFLIYFFCRAYLWHKIIEEKGHRAPFRKTVFLWEMAEIKRFAPGFIWPLISKTLSFSKDGLKKKAVAYSLAIEAEAFLVGCFIVSLLTIPLIINHFSMDPLVKNLILVILVVGAIISSVIFTFAKRLAAYIEKTKIPFLKKSVLEHATNSLPIFPPIINLHLLAMSSIGIFFFGLGTYLTIISISFLTPVLIWQLVGFFVLSLLVGYLSFLVPIGLGVREGVIIYGLTTFMPLPLASASAILARVTFIISELVFLGFTFILNKTKSELVLKTESFISTHKQEILTGVAIIIYIIYFTTATLLRYDNFHTGRFDLGNMDQTVWNTANGRIFQTTDGVNIVSRLSGHADFILIFTAPLYLIWADPQVLLGLQTIVLALGAVFVFKIAKMILNSKNAAAFFSLAYLLNPSLQFTNLYDFHPVTLATTLLLGAFYYFIQKKYLHFLFFAILAGLTKEQVWLVIAVFGLYILFFQAVGIARKKFPLRLKTTLFNFLFGLGVSGVSFFIFYYLIWIAIPQAREGSHFALSYYSDFGDSPFNVIRNILFSPGKIIEIIATGDRPAYLLHTFLPLGFISFLSPLALIFAVPDLGINLLSNNTNLHQIYYQYTAVITPFVFIAAIFGAKNLTKWLPKKETLNIVLFLVIFSTLISVHNFGPLPGAKNPNIDMFTKQLPDRKLIQSFIKKIPQEYKVAATNNLGSHLSKRQYIFTIPQGIENADIVAFLLNDPFAQPSLASQKEIVEQLKKDGRYKLLISRGDFVVFQKRN